MPDALRPVSSCPSSISFHHPLSPPPPSFPFFRLASKFTDSAIERLLFSRGCSHAEPFRTFPLLAVRPNTDGPADNLPLSIDRSSSRPHLLAYVFLARVSLDIFHVRQRPVGATRAFRFFLSRTLRPLLDFYPLMQEELSLLLSLPPFSSLLSPSPSGEKFRQFSRQRLSASENATEMHRCVLSAPRKSNFHSHSLGLPHDCSLFGHTRISMQRFRKTRNLPTLLESNVFSQNFGQLKNILNTRLLRIILRLWIKNRRVSNLF